jgi:hypothetical protein
MADVVEMRTSGEEQVSRLAWVDTRVGWMPLLRPTIIDVRGSVLKPVLQGDDVSLRGVEFAEP